jgi:hypothetical protein
MDGDLSFCNDVCGVFVGPKVKKSFFKTPISKINLILPREEPGMPLKTYDPNFWEIKNQKTR